MANSGGPEIRVPMDSYWRRKDPLASAAVSFCDAILDLVMVFA